MTNTVLSLLLLAILSVHSALANTPVNTTSFFEVANVPTEEFEIKFANLHINHKMAVFPQDDRICDKAFLLVFIPTRPSSFHIRDAIRSSWGKDGPQSVVVKFIIGRPADPELFYLLLGEQKMHGDLILYSIEDTYDNLYLKVHAAFQWQQAFCSTAKYVMKTDDDTIVDLNRLLYWIENKMSIRQQQYPAIIFGRMGRHIQPIRTPGKKWYVSEELFSSKYYPPFIYGGTYLLSSEAVSAILSNTYRVKAFYNEDVLFTGVVSNRAGVARENALMHFRSDRKIREKEECSNDGTPVLTSLYGFSNATDFGKYYHALRTIKCVNSSNSTSIANFKP